MASVAPLPEPPVRVLIADDQPDVRLALDLLLRSEGFETRDVAADLADRGRFGPLGRRAKRDRPSRPA